MQIKNYALKRAWWLCKPIMVATQLEHQMQTSLLNDAAESAATHCMHEFKIEYKYAHCMPHFNNLNSIPYSENKNNLINKYKQNNSTSKILSALSMAHATEQPKTNKESKAASKIYLKQRKPACKPNKQCCTLPCEAHIARSSMREQSLPAHGFDSQVMDKINHKTNGVQIKDGLQHTRGIACTFWTPADTLSMRTSRTHSSCRLMEASDAQNQLGTLWN